MSLKSDAETIQDLAGKIANFEILRAKLVASGGSVQIVDGDPDTSVPLSAAQRQALLAVEDGWKQTIKTLAAGW